MDQVQKADPRARRRARAMLLVVAGLGAWGLVVLDGWLAAQRAGDPDDARRALLMFLRWAAVGSAVVIGGFAAYAWRFGRRVRRDGRFPPVGHPVVRGTPILTGALARRRGAWAQAAGIAMAVLALVSLVVVFVVAGRLA